MTSRNPHVRQDVDEAVRTTLQSLDTIDETSLVGITAMGLNEIRILKQEIARMFPASNLPAFLLKGLLDMQDRTLRPDRIESDLKQLFDTNTAVAERKIGAEKGNVTDRIKELGAYSVLAAPAVVIHGYQKLLALAGKDVEQAFPEGYWQFYTEFGLREDAARHCVEATGFHAALPSLSDVDAATCWVSTAMRLLFAYDDMLKNEWYERILFRSLSEVFYDHARKALGYRPSPSRPNQERENKIAEHVAELRHHYKLERLESAWAAQRPYGGPPDNPLGSYTDYRRACFDTYTRKALKHLPEKLHTALAEHLAACAATELPAYQDQMTLLVTLHPDTYQEHRTHLSLDQACIGFVAGGRYSLIDVCARNEDGDLLLFASRSAPDSTGTALKLTYDKVGNAYDIHNQPIHIDRSGRVWAGDDRRGRVRFPSIGAVKRQIQAILKQARSNQPADAETPTVDMWLAGTPRCEQSELRARLDKTTRAAVEELRYAPIIINWDCHQRTRPLGEIRRTQRGCGDHALTLIRTDSSMVFDMSHICFDGVWGTALAEIMTSSATALAPLVAQERPTQTTVPEPLVLTTCTEFETAAAKAGRESPVEISVETNSVDLANMARLRVRLKKIELPLTINDILVLARCLHAASYQPGPEASTALETIGRMDEESGVLPKGTEMRRFIEEQLDEQREINPALLIPMDASAIDPGMRIYPATFRNPVHELPQRLAYCDDLVQQLRKRSKASLREEFEHERRELYCELRTFGALLETLKDVTMRGESFAVACLRLLSYLPDSLQYLLDRIPQKINMLNEIIKGREVFSNVGRVVACSSVTRFFSSRDDGETKWLVWGIMTTSEGQLVVTMRDFRPFVKPLVEAGHTNFARVLAQDYLETYATEANTTVRRIQHIFGYKAAK